MLLQKRDETNDGPSRPIMYATQQIGDHVSDTLKFVYLLRINFFWRNIMTKIFYMCCLTILAIGGLIACNSSTNSNSNTNSNRSAVNTALNTAGNAVNTMANTVSNMTTSGPDSFIKAATQGNMTEVDLGKLATTKAQNAEVKKFGQMMVTDHTKIVDDLKSLGAKKNVTLPTDIG